LKQGIEKVAILRNVRYERFAQELSKGRAAVKAYEMLAINRIGRMLLG
jgi:hypothetical protein